MFDIKKILRAPVIGQPWAHQIVENFFDKDTFKNIYSICPTLQKKYKKKLITGSNCLSIAEVYDIIGDKNFNAILDVNKALLNNVFKIANLYPSYNKFNHYISLPSLHILPPNTSWQKIHDESTDKTISIVVYLYPNKNIGTAMYKNSNASSLAKTISWVPNRSMIFCGQPNTTWHDFCSNSNTRISLNFFIRTFKSNIWLEELDTFVYTFGNGLKTYIPKNLPKDVLKKLQTDVFKSYGD